VAGFSLVGVPGTAGFISKWLLIVAALEQGKAGIGLVALILASSLMALFYVWRIVETLYFKPALQGDATRGEAPLQLLVMIWVAALANIFFGFFPQAPLALAELSAATLLGDGT
jgi:multicomponent Na+:H+ antiporter subunit D